MMNSRRCRIIALLMSACIHQAMAADSTDKIPDNTVQIDFSHKKLNNQYSNWNDLTLRANVALDANNRFMAELSQQDHFDDQGVFAGIGYQHVWNNNWYGSVHAGTSSGGFFLPQARYDVFINRKWLEQRQLVTTLGAGYYQAKDVHADRNVLLSGRYYFTVPVIAEIGMRINQSNPGDIFSRRRFAALTYGRYRQHLLGVRYESGREAYQLVQENTVVSDFGSHEFALNWRQWLGSNTGVQLEASRYQNPAYRRSGLLAGVFYEF